MKSVVLFIIKDNDNNRVLLSKSLKTNGFNSDKFYLPGGHIEDNEFSSITVERELKEELDLSPIDYTKSFVALMEIIGKEEHIHNYKGYNVSVLNSNHGDLCYVFIYKVVLEKNYNMIISEEISEIKWIDINDIKDSDLVSHFTSSFKNLIIKC